MKIIYFLFLTVFGFVIPLFAQDDISLQKVSWSYIEQDGANYSLRNINDKEWNVFSAKTKKYTANAKILWLRTRLFLASSNKQLALLLEKVCGIEQIYLNGRLLKQKTTSFIYYSRCPRSVIYPIPLHFLDEENQENTIAIRLIKGSKFQNPSIEGQFIISTFQKAELFIWKKNIRGFSYACLSFILAIFFLAIYLRLYHVQEYFRFSCFLFCYSIYKFTQNEVLYAVIDLAPLYDRINQFASIILPVLFYFFFLSFFRLKKIEFTFLSKRIEKNAEQLGNFYLLVSAVVTILCSISVNFTKNYGLLALWFLLQFPFLIYYFMIAFQKQKLFMRESISFIIGAVFFIFGVLYNILGDKRFDLFSSDDGGSVFLFNLSLSIGLFYGIILRRIEVEKHYTYLKSIDELQHRIFGYIGSLLAKPSQKAIERLPCFWEKKKSTSFLKESAREINENIEDIQTNLNLLMELARLEVLVEPEHIEEIDLGDFIQAVFANSKLTSHVRIKKNINIETGLDLMNSSMIHLLDFLEQQNFGNIDLVVTPKVNNGILFHFLAFHSNANKVREIYRVCNHISPLKDPRWLKWSIISETVRILQGKTNVSRIHGRFLKFGITLPQSIRTPFKYDEISSKNLEGIDDLKKQEINLIVTGAESSASRKSTQSLAKIDVPHFRSDMSIGEIISLIKLRWFLKKIKRN